MAKTSKIKKNEQRSEIVAKYAARRRELKAIIKDPTTTADKRADAYAALRKMPRDASVVRIRNRCSFSGRPRAFCASSASPHRVPRHGAAGIHPGRAQGELVAAVAIQPMRSRSHRGRPTVDAHDEPIADCRTRSDSITATSDLDTGGQ